LDAAFERALLDSAKHDGPTPEGTRAAWQALTASSAFLVVGGAAVSEGRSLFAIGTTKIVALIAVGAIGGSAATWAFLSSRIPSDESAAATPASSPTEQLPMEPLPMKVGELDATPAPVQPSPPRSLARAPASATPSKPSLDEPRVEASSRAQKKHQGTQGSGTTTRLDTPPDSSLAREVAELDRARSALWARDFDLALRRVEAFHAAFPRSQLAPDAEALAIEALRHQGAESAAARRAQRFLHRYPRDPHAERVGGGANE
jgi:TolA-binding protein